MASIYDIHIDFTSTYVKELYANVGSMDDYNKYLAQYLSNKKTYNVEYLENYVPEVHRSTPVFATYYPGSSDYAETTSFQEKTLSN